MIHLSSYARNPTLREEVTLRMGSRSIHPDESVRQKRWRPRPDDCFNSPTGR